MLRTVHYLFESRVQCLVVTIFDLKTEEDWREHISAIFRVDIRRKVDVGEGKKIHLQAGVFSQCSSPLHHNYERNLVLPCSHTKFQPRPQGFNEVDPIPNNACTLDCYPLSDPISRPRARTEVKKADVSTIQEHEQKNVRQE